MESARRPSARGAARALSAARSRAPRAQAPRGAQDTMEVGKSLRRTSAKGTRAARRRAGPRNCAEMTWLYTNGPSYDEPGEPGRTRGTTNSSQGSHGCRVRRVNVLISHQTQITSQDHSRNMMRKWPNAKQFSSSSLRLGRSFSVFYFFYLSHI